MRNFIVIPLLILTLMGCDSEKAELEAKLVEMEKIVEQAKKDAEHSAAQAIRAQAMAEANAAEALRAVTDAEKQVSELQKQLEACQKGSSK